MAEQNLHTRISKTNQYAQENTQMAPIQPETGKNKDSDHGLRDIIRQAHTPIAD